MRKWSFVLALLCCSAQAAVAAAPCDNLQGKCMIIIANGYHGVLGPLDYTQPYFTFQADIQFVGNAPDPVIGFCFGNHLAFTRTHQGQNPFSQFYSGFFSNTSTATGTYVNESQPALHLNWSAMIGPCLPPPPPPSAACIQCGVDVSQCISGASPGEKPACIEEYAQCRKDNKCK